MSRSPTGRFWGLIWWGPSEQLWTCQGARVRTRGGSEPVWWEEGVSTVSTGAGGACMVGRHGSGLGGSLSEQVWTGPGSGHMGTLPWTDRLTDVTENITFPQLCWWVVKILHFYLKVGLSTNEFIMYLTFRPNCNFAVLFDQYGNLFRFQECIQSQVKFNSFAVNVNINYKLT